MGCRSSRRSPKAQLSKTALANNVQKAMVELAQKIRRQHHDLPVLLASGYNQVLTQNGTYGFELQHKPYSIKQLSRLLSKVATWERRKRMLST
jgi:hypothetical protein